MFFKGGSITAPSTVGLSAPFSGSANFTDPGIADTHTASWDWGDGITTGTVTEDNGSGSVTNTHTYTTSGTYTITLTVTDKDGGVGISSKTITAANQVTALTPAKIWIGLKNSDDVGIKFDLLAEAYKDGNLIASGRLDSITGGSSGFNNAHLQTIPFDSFSAIDFPSGSVLSVKVYARNACTGSGKNSGTARLWYNDSAANSQFGTTTSLGSNNYFLGDSFALLTSTGSGPKKTVDISAGAKCSAFKTFGTWSKTL